MAAEALDIPALNTLVLASPISSIEQAVGRVQRNVTSSPLVIDIWDSFSIFNGQCKKRLSFFKNNGFELEYM
jgi:superfamily II DNA or RNA helicase